MRLNKRELALKLRVSERSLTTWQAAGMPVLEHGRRGQASVYDLAAVVRWIKSTGHGIYRVNLDEIERELGAVTASAYMSTGQSSYTIARAIMLARVAWWSEIPEWEVLNNIPAVDLIDAQGLFMVNLILQLEKAGFNDLGKIVDAYCSYSWWPDNFEEIRARCIAEVPPEQASR
jgi:hypothetical protein